MSDTRQAFEAWFAKTNPGVIFQSTGDRYIPSEVTVSWQAWKAAIAALGEEFDEYTVKQVGMRFGAVYENRIVFYDDKFTEFADALVEYFRAPEPRFPMTYCSQCGCECGPGDEGVSSCKDHK